MFIIFSALKCYLVQSDHGDLCLPERVIYDLFKIDSLIYSSKCKKRNFMLVFAVKKQNCSINFPSMYFYLVLKLNNAQINPL